MGKKEDLSDFERGMVVGARRAGLGILKTIIKRFWLTLNKNPPIHYLNKLEYLRPIQKHFK